MRTGVLLFIIVILLTVILGILDQAFGWINVFLFLDWLIMGDGGVLEMGAHLLFLLGYAGMLTWGTFENLLTGSDNILSEFTAVGFLTALTQFIMKGLGLIKAVIEFVVGIWAIPVVFAIDTLQVALAAFNVSLQLFRILPVTAFVTGFGIMLILFYYKRTGLSDRIRNIETGNPLLGGLSSFIEWLTGAKPGEQVDNAFKRLLLNFLNAVDPATGDTIVIHPQAPAWARDANKISLSDFGNTYAVAISVIDAINAPLEAIRNAFRTGTGEEPTGTPPEEPRGTVPIIEYPYE